MKTPERQTYFSRNCQGTQRTGSPGARSLAFAFYSPMEVSALGQRLSSGSDGITTQNSNLNIYNALQLFPDFGAQSRKPRGLALGANLDRARFVIIGFRRIHPSGAIV